jgi:Holliday junction resolvasome, DNA-binding subunit
VPTRYLQGVELLQKVDCATGARTEALSARRALGFTKYEAGNAIKAVFANGLATDEMISKALKVVK